MNVSVAQLVSELLRAVWSRPVWASIVVVGAALIGAVSGLTTVQDALSVQNREAYLLANGWSQVTVSSATGELLDADACKVVEEVPGVIRAGAVGPLSQGQAVGLDAGLSLTEVTPPVLDIIWPNFASNTSASAVMTPGFMALSGLSGGVLQIREGDSYVPVVTEPVTVKGRFPALDGGVLYIRGQLQNVAYCLVEVTAGAAEQIALDLSQTTSSYDSLAVPVLSRAKASPTPAELIDDHRQRWVPVMASSAILILGGLRLILVRRDRAIYRLLGFGRADLLLMGLVEFLVLLAVPTLATYATVVGLGQSRGVSTAILGWYDFAQLSTMITLFAVVYAAMWATGRNSHQFAPGA